MEFDVVIETPGGSRNTYETDHETGRIRLGRTLFTATRYPADHGYVVGTLGEDGDPLDALVVVDQPTVPGCVIRVRAVGMLRLRGEAAGDEVLCVPAGDVRRDHVQDITDVGEFYRREIAHFFQIYEQLRPGRSVEGSHWVGRAEAEAEIEASRERLARRGRPGGR